MKSLGSHTDYGHEGLSDDDVLADPIEQFRAWLIDAEQANIFEPNAMTLATVDADLRPSSRTVLLKGLTESGFEFVTNYDSHKGKALAAHADVCAVFPWYPLKRQVILYGAAERMSAADSDRHWAHRPHGAKLASSASRQSQPVDSREALDAALAELEQRYPEGVDVPRPTNWGAYLIRPRAIEFWAGRSMRFHDRFMFVRADDGSWSRQRLQP